MPDATPRIPRAVMPQVDDATLQAVMDALPDEWWRGNMLHRTSPSWRAKIAINWDDEGWPYLMDACGNVAELPAEFVEPAHE